jgi:hypothetical protein
LLRLCGRHGEDCVLYRGSGSSCSNFLRIREIEQR